jgi:hypothetical protein
MASTEELKEIIMEQIKQECKNGGEIHALLRGENHKRKDGIAGIMINKGNQMAPEKFENEAKSGTLFRHWSEEMKQYLKIVDENMMVLINIAESDIDKKTSNDTIMEYLQLQDNADLNGLDTDKYFAKFIKECDDDVDKLNKKIKQEKEEELHAFLMWSLSGEAKEMVRNAAPSGIEAWRALNFRWNRKTQFGATQIAEMIKKITRAKTPDEVYTKINSLDRLHL